MNNSPSVLASMVETVCMCVGTRVTARARAAHRFGVGSTLLPT